MLLPEALLPEWSGIDVPLYRTISATFRWKSDEFRDADTDSAMESALASIPDGLRWEPKGVFRIVGSPQVLFNSGEPGVEPLRPRMTLQIPVGDYDVLWARLAPDPATAAGLIQLRNINV